MTRLSELCFRVDWFQLGQKSTLCSRVSWSSLLAGSRQTTLHSPCAPKLKTAAEDFSFSTQKKRWTHASHSVSINPCGRCSKLNEYNLLITGYTKIASLTFFGNSLVRGPSQSPGWLTAAFKNTQNSSGLDWNESEVQHKSFIESSCFYERHPMVALIYTTYLDPSYIQIEETF